jgi:hypothetical protein
MNDLLRWIILHTSELSTETQSEWLVQQDFRILRFCDAPGLWEPVLREIVAAKCDLRWLVVGMETLSDAAWLACETLKQFAIQQALACVESLAQGDVAADVSEFYQTRLDFFRLCVGLDGVAFKTKI